MQKHPMLSVKEAAEALRIDERSVRDRLANGTLKGEKKQIGLRDKWFVYASAITSALAKQDGMNFIGNSVAVQESNEPQAVDATTVSVADEQDTIDATYGDLDEVAHTQAPPTPSRGDWHPENKANLESLVETFMKPLVDKVANQERALIEQSAIVAAQQREIEEQKIQLRLLPDLEMRAERERKAAEAAELRIHEGLALKRQFELVAEEKARALQEKEAELLAAQEEANAEKKLAELERRAAAERAAEIETLNERLEAMEEEKRLLAVKAAEAQELANDVQELKNTVERLQTPWWKKMLGG